jgi:hypothetical protein
MNKRAMSQETIGIIIVTSAIVLIALYVYLTVFIGSESQIADDICQWNVWFKEIIGIDEDELLEASPFFLCNQYTRTIHIDIDDANCNNFINFGKTRGFPLEECPYVIQKCGSDLELLDIEYCIKNSMTDSEIENNCHYKKMCEDGLESKNPVEKDIWEGYYFDQQINKLIERCKYISRENKEFDVPCYNVKFTGKDITIKDDLTDPIRYTKSFYDKKELIPADLLSEDVISSTIYQGNSYLVKWHEDNFNEKEEGYITIRARN